MSKENAIVLAQKFGQHKLVSCHSEWADTYEFTVESLVKLLIEVQKGG